MSPETTDKGSKRERSGFRRFLASFAFLVFLGGVAVGRFKVFPYPIVELAAKGAWQICTLWQMALPWYFKRVEVAERAPVRNTGQAYEGLNLVTCVGPGRVLVVKIMDMDGQTVHEWDVDWFRIWGDAKHVPKRRVPRARPGTHIHGAVVMDNGDLVFNFEHLGLVRLSRDGEVVWRLAYQTHHSIHLHDDGNLWVCGQKEHIKEDARLPNRTPPFEEYTLLEVTADGEIVEEWSVPDVLRENGRTGLLYLGGLENDSTRVEGDVLHLNDVEPFPGTLEADFFEQGDILVSLRNINTAFVFNRQNRKIKFMCAGWFVRQHDPDFIDGSSFSVFDNNNIAEEKHGHQSRIVVVSASDSSSRVFFEGSPETPFYTDIMGKHQWLPNGNLLITESRQGRAFEVNPQGEIVWECFNYVDRGVVGLVEEVQRLPLAYARLFRGGASGESEK